MNSAETSSPDSTSAAGAMLRRQVRKPVFVGCLLAGLGTSAGAKAVSSEARVGTRLVIEQTTAGAAVVAPRTAGAAIGELRLLSGLTWDQLARIFGVSRRSLHFWASGKPMTPVNEEHLQRTLALVHRIDRGSATLNRSALLTVAENGALLVDLLASGDYDRVFSLLGPGGTRRQSLPKLTDAARAARAPRPPEELVGALHDRIGRTSGPLRGTKAVVAPRRK